MSAMNYDDLIKHYGTQVAIAKALGIKSPSIAEWKAKGEIPEVRQYQIEVLTKGKLKASRQERSAA